MDTESRYSLRPAYRIIDAWVAERPENGPDACTDFHKWSNRLCELTRGHDGPHLALIVWGLSTPAAGEEQPG
jgi:hypothetical protein